VSPSGRGGPGGIDRRAFLRSAAAGVFALSRSAATLGAAEAVPCTAATPGAMAGPDVDAAAAPLYNGIRLARPWPPDRRSFPETAMDPPYLVDPPEVIPIDVGRQLFVDDFLIEETSLERTFHRAEYHPASPVLKPTKAWEKYDEYAQRTKTRSNPAAMVFSDGVFYDPDAKLFKMWYMGGYSQNTCYATSHDGLTWDKPSLDVVAGTNIVTRGLRDSSTVWLDLAEPDRTKRYKMAFYNGGHHALDVYLSADGIHWRAAGESGPSGDRSTFFYNPFRGVWVFSLRDEEGGGQRRYRRYWEAPDFVSGARWRAGQPVRWVTSDAADARRPEFDVPAEVYNLDCAAYESIVLGLFTIFRGERSEREKPNDVCVGYSRDGFHWARPDRRPFIPVSEQVGDWNWANVQSAGGCCLVVGDRLHFYVSGRQGVPGTNSPGVCSTGLATLRRDGFVSMDHPPAERVQRAQPSPPPGTLITRPIRFSGRHLFVNADCPGGELRVDVLDRGGRVIAPYAAAQCEPVREDTTRARVTWAGAADLAAVAGEPVRFRFHLTRGRLYAFWVAGSRNGASRGYVAAGGPGFKGIVDL
jgi:hypothetical protein